MTDTPRAGHFRWYFFFLLLIFCLEGFSQTVIISEDVTDRGQVPEFGVNRRHYRHFFVGMQFMAGSAENKGANIVPGRSARTEMGIRYIRRFSQTFASGIEWTIKRDAFWPEKSAGKMVPDAVAHDREKLVFMGVGLVVYQRTNFGKRGNHMGRFLDLGAYGDWLFHVRHVTSDKEEKERVRVRRTGLDYPVPFSYGVLARVGSGRLAIKATYRMSDLFKESVNLPEFPRFTVGVEVGVHH